MTHRPQRNSRLLVPIAAAILLVFGAFWTTSFMVLTKMPPPDSPLLDRHPVHIASVVTPSPPIDDPVQNVLHSRAAFLPNLTIGHRAEVRPASSVTSLDGAAIVQWTEYFPQHGQPQRGIHWRLQNRNHLSDATNKHHDSVLLLVVLKDHRSWGLNRSSTSLFNLLSNFTFPKHKVSLTVLVSNLTEFNAVQQRMHLWIREYSQFSLLFRNDFNSQRTITRENRHAPSVQNERRRLLARYRNFALLSTLQTWHQHVLWLDADVERIPSHLVTTMVTSHLDIVEPICYRDAAEYDRNAWVGTRTKPEYPQNRTGFVPMGLRDRHMIDYRHDGREFIPLDSVGGTMLYVRADVHRQGVLFPHHYVIGSEWAREGYDGIETEGLCYEAHFLGYKCWGMPQDKDAIHHVGGASMAN